MLGVSGLNPVTGQPTVILDNAENWYGSFGQSDDPLRPYSWFEIAMREIGRSLGLGDTNDLPPGTIMGSDPALAYGNADVPEPVYPGDQDIVHGRHLYRNEGKDIDLYRFQLTETGVLSAEILAERLTDASLLDAVIALYREENGQRELIARNDDYFSDDSFLQMTLEAGVYYIGVSAAGNIDYNPAVEDTGFGGLSEGQYDLRLTFRPDADSSLVDVDNALNTNADSVSRATAAGRGRRRRAGRRVQFLVPRRCDADHRRQDGAQRRHGESDVALQHHRGGPAFGPQRRRGADRGQRRDRRKSGNAGRRPALRDRFRFC